MITSATPSQVSVATAPVAPPTFMADNQQSVFKPLAPVVKSDAMAAGDKERHIQSPLFREVAASGFTREAISTLVTYNKDGRLSSSINSVGNQSRMEVAARASGEVADGRKEEGADVTDEQGSLEGEADAKKQLADSQKEAVTAEREAQKQEEIRVLAARDREVRAHEQAHAAVGGAFAGAPKYQFERGPDGVNYAVGGEVPIDISPAATPEATISKMQTVRRAALAPAEPSPQDRRVAQEAIAAEARARQEMVQEQRMESQQSVGGSEGASDNAERTSETEVPVTSGTEKESRANGISERVNEANTIDSREVREPAIRSISVVA